MKKIEVSLVKEIRKYETANVVMEVEDDFIDKDMPRTLYRRRANRLVDMVDMNTLEWETSSENNEYISTGYIEFMED